MLREGMFLADRYEIIEQIGTGGMADVYKAKCHKLNRNVAIKVLKSEFSEDKTFVSKFRAEAQAAAGLTHANIVNVYDVGDENGIYYIVMELVEGITLKKYIEKRGRIPYKEAVSIAIQVANGMDVAHKHHIIHRDIKPQNIIISKEGKVKVTDFGIARAATSATINSSASMGSVHYISPEQARGGYSDERSDIYSLGITIFEMLTGTVPYDGDTAVAVAVRHIQDEIPLPSELVDDIPISIDKIVLKCTQKRTERRYQTAANLIVDLKKSLVMPDEDFVKILPTYKDTPVSAKEDSLTENDMDEEDLVDDLDDLDDLSELNDDFSDEEDTAGHRKKKDVLDEDYDTDIDDEGSEKIDLIMKYIGIGIAVIILIITAYVIISLMNNGRSNPEKQSQEDTTAETVSQKESTEQDDGKEKVEVPNVIGYSKEDAIKALNERNLGYKAVTQSSQTVAEGHVISQGNAAGSMIPIHSQVILTISSGKEQKNVDVPNVIGKEQSVAEDMLTKALFEVDVKFEFSDTVPMNQVISYSPSGSVSEGSTITITVSRGQDMVTVPNVVGRTESEANQILTEAGLKPRTQTTANTTKPYGQVISQTPYKEGDSVAKGTEITILVSRYTERTTQAQTQPTTQAQTIQQTTQAQTIQPTTQVQPTISQTAETTEGSPNISSN